MYLGITPMVGLPVLSQQTEIRQGPLGRGLDYHNTRRTLEHFGFLHHLTRIVTIGYASTYEMKYGGIFITCFYKIAETLVI